MRFIELKGIDFNAQVKGSARIYGSATAANSIYLDDGHWLRLSHQSTVCPLCFLRYEKGHNVKSCNERIFFSTPDADRLSRFAGATMQALQRALTLDDILTDEITLDIISDRVDELEAPTTPHDFRGGV